MPRQLNVRACLEKLLRQVESEGGNLTGLAFIAHVEGKGWIADACGTAYERPHEALEQLPGLDAKLSRLHRSKRS